VTAPRSPLVPVFLGTALVLATYVTPIVSVPVTAADLHAGAGSRAWILSSMSVGLAGALLVSGAIGDTVGRRRTYDAGLGAVTLGAVVSAVAWHPLVVVLGRVVEGVGGAAVLACGLSLLAAYFEGPARGRATAMWGAGVGLGIAAGSALASLIGLVGTGWRETYVVVAVLALLLVPASRGLADVRAGQPRRIDAAGTLLLVLGMTLLVAGLTEARDGIGAPTVALVVTALVVLALFVLVEARAAEPLVELELLRHRGFLTATLGSLTLGVGMIGMSSFVPTMVQSGLGGGLGLASLLVSVWALTSVAASLALDRLPWTVAGPRGVAAVLVLVAAGQLVGIGLLLGAGAWWIAASMAASGVGTGVLNAVLGREAVASVPADRTAMGSGANNTARYLGAALGITLFVTLATHVGDTPATGWAVATAVAGTCTLLGAAAVLVLGGGLGGGPGGRLRRGARSR